MCEWVSMIPGMATSPAASITVTPGFAFTSGPTAVILPFSIRIEPRGIVPLVTVRIVASLISTLPPVLIAGARSGSNSVATSTNGGEPV